MKGGWNSDAPIEPMKDDTSYYEDAIETIELKPKKKCIFCELDEINKIDLDGEEDFGIKFDQGSLDVELLLHNDPDEDSAYLELYRMYRIGGFIYDGMDRSARVNIDFCPKCGKDLRRNKNGTNSNIR